jgi:hypothetical protein
VIHFEEKYGVTVGAATMLRQRRQAREARAELKARAELEVGKEPEARQTKMEPVARAEPEARQARVARAEPLRFLILVESRYTLTCRTKTSFCLFNE